MGLTSETSRLKFCRRKVPWGGEAEAAGHAGEYVEDDNRRPFHAVNEALEEGRHVGDARSEEHAGGPKQPDASRGDEEVGDVQRPPERRRQLDAEPVVRVGEAPEGAVAGSGRVEPTGGGVHQEVQRGNAAAKAGIVESIPGDDRTRGPLALHAQNRK